MAIDEAGRLVRRVEAAVSRWPAQGCDRRHSRGASMGTQPSGRRRGGRGHKYGMGAAAGLGTGAARRRPGVGDGEGDAAPSRTPCSRATAYRRRFSRLDITDGTAQREALRRFWMLTVQPLTDMVSEEPARTRAAGIAGHRSRGPDGRRGGSARAARALVDAGVPIADTMRRVAGNPRRSHDGRASGPSWTGPSERPMTCSRRSPSGAVGSGGLRRHVPATRGCVSPVTQ